MIKNPEHAPVDVSPTEVRAGLQFEDQVEFDRDWHDACLRAADTFSLDPIRQTLESYRRRALLANQLGPEGYRELLAEADRRVRTEERVPGSVPLDQVKAMIAERLGRQMYTIDTDPVALDQLRALPDEALLPYGALLSMLELAPWRGDPDGAARTMPFGTGGLVTYVILEDQLRVDILKVIWAD